MPNKKKEGIWCEKNRTWYYLETNGLQSARHLDRLKAALIARNLIDYTREKDFNTPEYKVMKYHEALEKEYKCEAIYISEHVKNEVLKDKENESKTEGWS